MTNAELIKALKDAEMYIRYVAPSCIASSEAIEAIRAAADALEAAEKRIADLERIMKAVQENSGINFRLWQEAEAQLPKDGVWIELDDPICYAKQCSVCGAAVRVCIGEMCTTAETYAKYCPNCGARMANEQKRNEEILFGGIENV